MTELQRVEFDMLQEVIRICDALNLRYYLVCGSALGAAKYGGFIPWDDDMDIGLLREDYLIFTEKAPSMLPEHLFLQNHKTDPQYPHMFSKIRNCQTTYIEKSVAGLNMNHGVYIDLFPLDGYPQDQKEQVRLERKKTRCQKRLSCVFDLPRNFKATIGMRLRRVCGYHKKTAQLLDEYTSAISGYPTADSKLICNHGNWQGRLEYAPREQYGKGIMAKFEGSDIRIPERYDEYLTQKYGNWRGDLPKEQQVGHHYYAVCDPTRPYTDYVEQLPGGKIRIRGPKELA